MTGPITAWSASRLSKYEECPKSLYFTAVMKLPEPKHPAMERGIMIHKQADAYLTAKTDDLPDAKAMDKFKVVFAELRTMQPIVEQQWAYAANWRATSWFGKDTWYRATLDAGVLYADNWFTVVDHKTGKPWGHNKDQMEQFAMAVMARYPQVTGVDTRLWYLDTGDEQKGEFLRKDFVGLRDKWVKRAAVMINDNQFAARPGNQCARCHFRKSNGGPCVFG